ncbi:uncharacterized protein HD556DRAFT_188467 [Suillus plorans]|uniref:Uncharacterized protein n=1 Tax=Suillus plorans TaxID=116603 RepID=A0A9P7DMK6_9AGAM|nr:uncharacterized protein HD556DRAFT_188467 [Suillus plorans]KAG1798519.1 hypothetical protein HD556DRAFT_188467 [Suillus plorans]
MGLRSQRLLYPLGMPIVAKPVDSCQHLGHSLSSKDYHATYYVPIILIVTGKLSTGTKSLLAVVQDKVEPSIISHGQNHGPARAVGDDPS